jgi:hypothetical protein
MQPATYQLPIYLLYVYTRKFQLTAKLEESYKEWNYGANFCACRA